MKKIGQHKLIGLFLLLFTATSWSQNTKRYDLYVSDTLVHYSGKERKALAVNGQIPMPTLKFTEGDIAEIYVHNRSQSETALHWHGLYVPNAEDGVPYLTQMPIAAGSTYVYRFPIIQNGTYWYHSHSGFQEQLGMYGALIIEKKAADPNWRAGIDDLPSIPLVISEWTDLKPENIQRMLHTANDWFAVKKGATQSYYEALTHGALGAKLTNEWKRMQAMDVSDVYYEKMLINGKAESQLEQFKPGERVRLQLVNAGASTYFWIHYAGGKIEVVAQDGNDVKTVEVDRLIVAPSETVDLIVTVGQAGMAYELLATAEDRSNSTSVFIGQGRRQLAVPLEKLKYFEGMKMMNDMMKLDGSMNPMGMEMSMQTMDMNAVMYPEVGPEGPITLNYAMLESPQSTRLPDQAPVKELRFELSGNMNRYVWSLDNKVVSESDRILIKKGQRIRMTLYNGSMMRHPMHLHGHDFRVLNGKGDYAPLKNVIDIMPMETNVIEFLANNEGDWYFHCHILYHMMTGMGRIFTYENQQPNPHIKDVKAAKKMIDADDRMFFLQAESEFATNGAFGGFSWSNTRWSVDGNWEFGYESHQAKSADLQFGRYIGKMQWFKPFVGVEWQTRKGGHFNRDLLGQAALPNNRLLGKIGFTYTLPFLLELEASVNTAGILRMQLAREDIPLTARLRGAFSIDTQRDYSLGLKYLLTRNLSLTSNYYKHYGFGMGIHASY